VLGGVGWGHVESRRGNTRPGAVPGWARLGRRLSGVCAAIGVVALVAVVAGLARPAAADARARFFHFNACGNTCAHGLVGPAVQAIEDSILDFRPHAVGLNEMVGMDEWGWEQLRLWLNARAHAKRGRGPPNSDDRASSEAVTSQAASRPTARRG
jgi:hypothetical protein